MTNVWPTTAIVMGAGCSVGQGIPTMVDFMDKVLGKNDKYTKQIENFIQDLRSSGSYISMDFLNIEELYGMVDLAEDMSPYSTDAKKTRRELNRKIFEICKKGGDDLIGARRRRYESIDNLQQILKDSSSEEIQPFDQGGKYTNTLAHLCLSVWKDEVGMHPLFVNFNWDPTIDRSMEFIYTKKSVQIPNIYITKETFSYKFDCFPIVTRPHGGLVFKKEKGDLKIVLENDEMNPAKMIITPPTWRKHASNKFLRWQWQMIAEVLKHVRRIVFIGYSLPRTDLHFRHFLMYALSKNNYSPKVYVWNPGILHGNSEDKKQLRKNYVELFMPLARQWRLFGIDAYFGNPALFDLTRAMQYARPLLPEMLSE